MPTHHHRHQETTPESLVAAAVTQLRARGERVTHARKELLDLLAQDHKHVTAEEISSRLAVKGIHRATVYRTLELFAAIGIVTHRQLAGGASAYHFTSPTHLHAHCRVCQRVIALPVTTFDQVTAALETNLGFSLNTNLSTIVGECDACRGTSKTLT